VPSKSIGHHKAGTEPEQVEEEPMVIARAKETQQQMTKNRHKTMAFLFFTFFFLLFLLFEPELQ
jgi:hypothetical protein